MTSRRGMSGKTWIWAIVFFVLPIALALLWFSDAERQSLQPNSATPPLKTSPAVVSPSPNPAVALERAPPVAAGRDGMRRSDLSDSVFIQGVVQGAEGDPVPFAEISIFPLESDQALAVVSTDPAGRYQIEAAPDLTVRATVERDAFVPLEDYLDLPARGALNRDFMMRRATSSVRARIVDESNQPVSGAQVRIGFPAAPDPAGARYLGRTAETGFEGFFEVENLPPVEITLIISARGFFEEMRHVQLEEGRQRRLRFKLRRGRLRSLTVTDTDGQPIESARLDCGPLANYYSDAEGKLEFVLPNTDSSIQCEVSAPGHLSQWLPIDPEVSNTKVALRRGPRFEGVVLSESGRPAAGAEVVVSGRDNRFEGMVETQSDGRFSMTLAWPPVSHVSVTHPDFVPYSVRLGSDEEASSVEIRLRTPEGVLFGRVVESDGSPMPRFHIFLSDGERRFSRTFEDREGRFEFNNLPAGSFRAVVTTGLPDYLWMKAEAGPFEIQRGRRLGEMVIRFPKP